MEGRGQRGGPSRPVRCARKRRFRHRRVRVWQAGGLRCASARWRPMDRVENNESDIANAVRSSAIEFLRVELKIGNTMLDLAAAASDQEAKARRYAQATEACN